MADHGHAGRFRTLRLLAAALGFGAVVILLLLWLAGTFHPKIDARAGGQARLQPVDPKHLAPVRRIEVPASESAVGTVRAVQQATLTAEVMAKVVEVNARAGQAVRKGEVLVRLDPEELRARLQQAEAAVSAAVASRDLSQTEFDRVQGLYKQNNAAQIEFQRAEAALKSAVAELEQAAQARAAAAKNLSFTTIVSPFDGIVIDKQVDVGDIAAPQKILLTLYDPTQMQLVASVRESLIDRVHPDQELPVHIDALDRQCSGKVTEIVPESDVSSRSFLVKVRGPCPPDIHPGMFGRLLIPMDAERWLVIPHAAVRRIGQLDVVDTVAADGKTLERRVVRTGRTRDDDLEILSGLKAGEQVAVPTAATPLPPGERAGRGAQPPTAPTLPQPLPKREGAGETATSEPTP